MIFVEYKNNKIITVTERKDLIKGDFIEVTDLENLKLPLYENYIVVNGQLELNEIIKKLEEKEKRNDLSKKLKILINTKRKELKNNLTGMDIDTEQEEAYQLKYQIALAVKEKDANAINELLPEANIRKLEVEKLADLIIKKHDEWINILKSFNQKLDVFRIKMNELIKNNDFEKAKKILEKAEKIDVSVTYNDILKLFN